MARDQVFISYSHADSEWLERLQTMLAPLQRQGTLDVWADTRIQPGQLWKEEIQKALARAKVAVLLVSPDFLASEFIYKDELPPLLEASSKEGLTILWVPVRPSLYSETTIAHYQAAFEPRTPLSTLAPAQQETALVVIAKKLTAIRPIPAPAPVLPPASSPSPSPSLSPSTTPIPEQIPQTPSSSPRSPSPSSTLPPQPSGMATTRHGWKLLLIGVVLGILSGAGVYHMGHKWFEQAFNPTSGPADIQRRPFLPPKAVMTAEPADAVTSPPRPDSMAKPSSLPPTQNIHGWSAPQVQDLQQQTAQALETKVEFRDNLKDGGQGPLMVVIPAGRFQMGSPDTEPERSKDERQHWVDVTAFAISKYEVTFEEYDHFADATNRKKPTDASWGRGRRPVINVTWDDTIAYTDWLSKQTGQTYRLPTEAEWEYAARAGTTTPFYFGETINTDQANYDGNSIYDNGRKGVFRQKTVEVGQFPPNAWGLHDMHGNVWEWTCSVYDENYAGGEQRCMEPGTRGPCVLRGGSWGHGPGRLRGAARYGYLPHGRDVYVGFRLARTFPSPL